MLRVENYFFFLLSSIAMIFAIGFSIKLYKDQNKIAHTIGRIVEIELLYPEVMMNRNVKLATLEYQVGGRRYFSENKMKMPISADIGDEIELRYYRLTPEVLYLYSTFHIKISLWISVACLLLGLLDY